MPEKSMYRFRFNHGKKVVSRRHTGNERVHLHIYRGFDAREPKYRRVVTSCDANARAYRHHEPYKSRPRKLTMLHVLALRRGTLTKPTTKLTTLNFLNVVYFLCEKPPIVFDKHTQ